ncbi:hypothetical protein GDO81_023096 [Engystomops pustulosus]|uniref:Uncharacterized protein n=1 Tax=Engystomops pustulosus TaxID=76066 RepID=A0AAV6Z3D5_ENGPU|nr:hypothetical protein GDO81_023096 [Engystomops pustulosus]
MFLVTRIPKYLNSSTTGISPTCSSTGQLLDRGSNAAFGQLIRIPEKLPKCSSTSIITGIAVCASAKNKRTSSAYSAILSSPPV